MEEWKKVPEELAYGGDVWATKSGRVRCDGIELVGHNGPISKGKHYTTFKIQEHTFYFHRAVFYAFSDLPVATLASGRVLFGPVKDGMVRGDRYTNRFEDLVFEPHAFDPSAFTISSEREEIHPKYGKFWYGRWYPLHVANKETKTVMQYALYRICIRDDAKYPCVIQNISRGENIHYVHKRRGYDPMVSLTNVKKSTKMLLVPVILASVFQTVAPDETVDHIDDDPTNHRITNLEWRSMADNARKGQQKARLMADLGLRKETSQAAIEGEIWATPNVTPYTAAHYEVSNRGRIKNKDTGHINSPCVLRDTKYSSVSVAIRSGIYKHYYMHRLVYIAFHGAIPAHIDICHNDKAPLNPNGTYRNWLEDLRLGTRTENNEEHHEAKRNRLATATPSAPTDTVTSEMATYTIVDAVCNAGAGEPCEVAGTLHDMYCKCHSCSCMFYTRDEQHSQCYQCVADHNSASFAYQRPVSYSTWKDRVQTATKRTPAVTDVQYEELAYRPCSFCGYHMSGQPNSLVRVDMQTGYTVDNLRPACSMCEAMRGHRAVAHFIQKAVHLAVEHMKEYDSRCIDTRVLAHYATPTTDDIDYDKFKKKLPKRLTCTLAEEDYNTLRNSPCYVCGYQPLMESCFPRSREFSVVGRIDPRIKQVSTENCAPYCQDCLDMKGQLSPDQFIEHIVAVTRRSEQLYDDIQDNPQVFTVPLYPHTCGVMS